MKRLIATAIAGAAIASLVSPYQIRHPHDGIGMYSDATTLRSRLRLSASSCESDYGSDEFMSDEDINDTWGQSEDGSALSTAASSSFSVPATYNYDPVSDLEILEAADELLDEQQLILSDSNAEDDGDSRETARRERRCLEIGFEDISMSLKQKKKADRVILDSVRGIAKPGE